MGKIRVRDEQDEEGGWVGVDIDTIKYTNIEEKKEKFHVVDIDLDESTHKSPFEEE